jgi:MerR family transcriptional regulator/heat shock protein HspR
MAETNTKAWLKIGEAARQLDLAVETIRMYEREGLLLVHKTATGQRLFDESDVHWIGCIRRLIKEKGLNLEGIRRLLALIPCWELRPCSEEERKNCPAYLGGTRPCWMMKADLSENCRTFNCRDCQAYQIASHCDNLKTLLRKQLLLKVN